MIAYKTTFQSQPGIFESFVVMGKYRLAYRVGHSTKAPTETMGIFCFETVFHAKNFGLVKLFPESSVILKVEGIGEPSYPHFVAQNITSDTAIGRFKKLGKIEYPYPEMPFPAQPASFRKQFDIAPAGTICFPEIFVIGVEP